MERDGRDLIDVRWLVGNNLWFGLKQEHCAQARTWGVDTNIL